MLSLTKGGVQRAVSIFPRLSQHLPIAWLQLSFGVAKLVAAVIGVVVADMLIWTQLGFYNAAMNSTVVIHRQLLGDLVVVTAETQQLVQAGSFSRRQLIRLKAIQPFKRSNLFI